MAQTRNTIAIAASLSAGVVANYRTVTKPLNVGRHRAGRRVGRSLWVLRMRTWISPDGIGCEIARFGLEV